MRKINESQINPPDVKAVFKTAVDIRNSPSKLSKIFRSAKPTIDISDLQAAWKEDHYSDDTADIERILLDHGFSKKEINKVFSEVFGQDDSGESYAEPTQSTAVLKIAQLAKNDGIAQEIIAFLQKEYGFTESRKYPDKAVIEDIRQIFTRIVKEERSGRTGLIKEYQQANLGRTKK